MKEMNIDDYFNGKDIEDIVKCCFDSIGNGSGLGSGNGLGNGSGYRDGYGNG